MRCGSHNDRAAKIIVIASKPGRVVSGDCSPETPTEPDVQVFRILCG